MDNMMADTTNEQLIVDPPSGWMYGFPKQYFKNKIDNETEVKNWLIENGYPKSEIDSLGKSFHIRCWYK